MKKALIYSAAVASVAFASVSCDLITPGDVVNPNVDEDSYLTTADIMSPWRNGMERDFATTVGKFAELTEIISDNYFNNYTMSSKVFDRPQITYDDVDVNTLQSKVAQLRESAIYGIDKVAPADVLTTDDDIYTLKYIKAYSFWLAGEYFTGLPQSVTGTVQTWQVNLETAISEFDSILSDYSSIIDDEAKAGINLIIARSYYRLGQKDSAVEYAKASLALSDDFVAYVYFDGINGVTNMIQSYSGNNNYFQPLPRLDFLDPKYIYTDDSTEQRPIAYAKAEEAYLILAEAEACTEGGDAESYIEDLLDLVASRPTYTINDGLETRAEGAYPNDAAYKVAASSSDDLRTGLVLTRSAESPTVTVPYISGTSVDESMVGSTDDMIETIYLLRQEILFAEGRRVADLGIRIPVAIDELSFNSSAADFIEAQIPSFIPTDQGMDKFTLDADKKEVVITYNMNQIISDNQTSEYVVPFK